MRYSYHNRIKQRISNNELTGHKTVKDYPRIGEALVLMFKTEPFVRPIRPHSYHLYAEILKLDEQ